MIYLGIYEFDFYIHINVLAFYIEKPHSRREQHNVYIFVSAFLCFTAKNKKTLSKLPPTAARRIKLLQLQ